MKQTELINQEIYMFGGENEFGCSNELYSYNLGTDRYRKYYVFDPPERRKGCKISPMRFNQTFLMFGGVNR